MFVAGTVAIRAAAFAALLRFSARMIGVIFARGFDPLWRELQFLQGQRWIFVGCRICYR
jgi:hypothetical protein